MAKLGHNDRYGSGGDTNQSPRGIAMSAGDDFYVVKVDRDDDEWDYEDRTGGERGLHRIKE